MGDFLFDFYEPQHYICDIHFKFEEGRTKAAVAIESDSYSDGQTDRQALQVILYLSNAINCIGQTKMKKKIVGGSTSPSQALPVA